jgi:hypothetical protein
VPVETDRHELCRQPRPLLRKYRVAVGQQVRVRGPFPIVEPRRRLGSYFAWWQPPSQWFHQRFGTGSAVLRVPRQLGDPFVSPAPRPPNPPFCAVFAIESGVAAQPAGIGSRISHSDARRVRGSAWPTSPRSPLRKSMRLSFITEPRSRLGSGSARPQVPESAILHAPNRPVHWFASASAPSARFCTVQVIECLILHHPGRRVPAFAPCNSSSARFCMGACCIFAGQRLEQFGIACNSRHSTLTQVQMWALDSGALSTGILIMATAERLAGT